MQVDRADGARPLRELAARVRVAQGRDRVDRKRRNIETTKSAFGLGPAVKLAVTERRR